MATQAQKKASAKYDKNNTRSILFKFNLTTDADILAKLDSEENRQGYFKKLVRADIKGKSKVLTLESIKLMIIPVAKKFGVSRAYLFGSYARGEATSKSDLDIMIEGEQIETMSEYLALSEALEVQLGKPVDIVSRVSVENNNTRAGKRMRAHIERDKVLIYEA